MLSQSTRVEQKKDMWECRPIDSPKIGAIPSIWNFLPDWNAPIHSMPYGRGRLRQLCVYSLWNRRAFASFWNYS